MIRRILYTFICFLLCFSLTACSANVQEDSTAYQEQTSSTEETVENENSDIPTELTLPYTESDSFNPYAAQSVNNITITHLMYDGLVTITPDFSLEYLIADSVNYSSNTISVHIRDGAKFTDSTSITAQDVIYSFNKAKTSVNYQAQLSSILSVSGNAQNVTFTMSSPNTMAGYLLDFPIVKNKSAEGTDTPIGSGRYKLNDGSSDLKLEYNSNYFKSKSPKFNEIKLEISPSLETTEAGIKIGWYDIAYRGASENTMGGTGAITKDIPAPQLLYVGVNQGQSILSNPHVRKALSAAIDRDELLRSVYGNRGVATDLPIYPSFSFENSATAPSGVDEANRLLDEAGLTQKDSYDVRYLDGKPMTFEILVPQSSSYLLLAANSVSSMLSRCGIQTKIVSLSDGEYHSRIASGNYTLYIGELRQTNDCSLAPFMTGGAASYGLAQPDSLKNLYQNFLADTSKFSAFAQEFYNQTPFIPLCYRNDVLVHSRNLASIDIQPSVSDIFYNITEW